MNILWESVKATAGIVGQAAVETGMKGKIQAELLLISNEIDTRKRVFGEQLYEFVVRSMCRNDFILKIFCLRLSLSLTQRSNIISPVDATTIGTSLEDSRFLRRQ
jgi:hypothetical protein